MGDVERDEYRRMAAVEDAHWWYHSTRMLLAEKLVPHLVADGGDGGDGDGGDGGDGGRDRGDGGRVDRRRPRLLDAGCGTGATGAWMAAHGDVVGVDAEPLALELYGRRAGVVGLAAADLARLPFSAASFDAALCVTVLYHRAVASPAAAVAELVRVVRPGGVVCLLEPGVRRLYRAHDREVHGARRFSLRDMRTLLTDAGCDIVTATGAYAFLVPPAFVKALIERRASSSDLDRHDDGLHGVLPGVARLERAVLRRTSLPFGLSVLAIGRVR